MVVRVVCLLGRPWQRLTMTDYNVISDLLNIPCGMYDFADYVFMSLIFSLWQTTVLQIVKYTYTTNSNAILFTVLFSKMKPAKLILVFELNIPWWRCRSSCFWPCLKTAEGMDMNVSSGHTGMMSNINGYHFQNYDDAIPKENTDLNVGNVVYASDYTNNFPCIVVQLLIQIPSGVVSTNLRYMGWGGGYNWPPTKN